MDFQKLKLFEQVAEHGSLTKAAVALDSVPSAISRQISALEREDPANHRRLFTAPNDPELGATLRAAFEVDIEYALE